MILYRKNENWSHYSSKCLIDSDLDNKINDMINHLSAKYYMNASDTDNINEKIDIVDISIRNNETYHFITIFYAILPNKPIENKRKEI